MIENWGMRKCEYRPCDQMLPLHARKNQRYCSPEHGRRAWQARGVLRTAMKRSTKNGQPPDGRRQCLTEDASATIQRYAPPGTVRYQVYLSVQEELVFFPKTGVSSHLTFEGFRRPGDAFEFIPNFEMPRVSVEDHYTVRYLSRSGGELPSRGRIMVLLPSSATDPPSKHKLVRKVEVGQDSAGESKLTFPREILRTALGGMAGNVSRAAVMLGVSRTQFVWQLAKAGIRAADFRPQIGAARPHDSSSTGSSNDAQ